MKTKNLLIVASMACLSVMLFSACKNKPKTEVTDPNVAPATTAAAMPKEDPVKRGSYLVNVVGGCGDCHTPKNMTPQGVEPIQALMLSGYRADMKLMPVNKDALKKGWILMTPDLNAFAGPWGISFAANITSDATGIGNWPEENFLRAIKQGKFKGIEGGRSLLPPMPWQNLANATDEDLKAIFAYLKTVPPVNNVVPMAVLPPDIK
jgi:hypothetical protein